MVRRALTLNFFKIRNSFIRNTLKKKIKIRNLNLNNVQVKKLAKSGFVSFLGHTRARGIVGNHLPAMTKSDCCLCGVKTPAPE